MIIIVNMRVFAPFFGKKPPKTIKNIEREKENGKENLIVGFSFGNGFKLCLHQRIRCRDS